MPRRFSDKIGRFSNHNASRVLEAAQHGVELQRRISPAFYRRLECNLTKSGRVQGVNSNDLLGVQYLILIYRKHLWQHKKLYCFHQVDSPSKDRLFIIIRHGFSLPHSL
jgi:hypothetical protein